MSTTYAPAEAPSRIARILLAPAAAVISLFELTLPRDERGGQAR
jgi:hypothetical protein